MRYNDVYLRMRAPTKAGVNLEFSESRAVIAGPNLRLQEGRFAERGATLRSANLPGILTCSQTVESEELGEIGAMYKVRIREGRETVRYCLFAASIDPESLKAFKAAQRSRRREVRGLRRSARLRKYDTAGGWRKVVSEW